MDATAHCWNGTAVEEALTSKHHGSVQYRNLNAIIDLITHTICIIIKPES